MAVVAEDEITLRKHIEFLQKESRKTEPNTKIIQQKMAATAPYRREKIERTSVAELLLEFPPLRWMDGWMVFYGTLIRVDYVSAFLR